MSDARRYRTATGVALIVGPALFLVDNLIHPEELTRGNEAEQLAEIAASPDRWQIAHLIGFVSLIFFTAAALGLAYVVVERRRRLGLVGGGLAMIGLLALAFAFALDGYTWGTLGSLYDDPALDRQTLAETLDRIQSSGWSLPYYSLVALFGAGMVALAWGVAQEVGRRRALLLGVGVVLVGLEGLIQDNAYFIASSAVLLAGGLAVGMAFLRRPP